MNTKAGSGTDTGEGSKLSSYLRDLGKFQSSLVKSFNTIPSPLESLSPLANNVDDFSEIIYERSTAARIESAMSQSLPVIDVLLSVCFFVGAPDGASRGA